MPKNIDYPRSSFKASLELAEAVYSLGGSCTVESCADQMGKKVSGGFRAIIGGALKFGLIDSKGGQLSNTQLYKNIHLAYTDEERKGYEREAFLKPPVFSELIQKFSGIKLPAILNKMLEREYEVDAEKAGRIAKYFIDGSKSVGLIDGDNKVTAFDSKEQDDTEEEENSLEKSEIEESDKQNISKSQQRNSVVAAPPTIQPDQSE